MGIESEPVPVTGFAVNFSPMLRMAPPPLGAVICGAKNAELSGPLPADPGLVKTGTSAITPVPNTKINEGSKRYSDRKESWLLRLQRKKRKNGSLQRAS
jgi:hypothetical protein